MAAEFDGSDFVDTDFQSAQKTGHAAPGVSNRPPSREELEGKVSDAQTKLAELKRAQEELERERAQLEEARRRQIEYQTGREEMTQHLTRGVALLEEAEFAIRREAEQMAKTLAELREAQAKVLALNDTGWTKENYNIELTRALTTLENARMEWNGARLKWTVLDKAQQTGEDGGPVTGPARVPNSFFPTQNFGQLCRLGFALTWPIALVVFLGVLVLLLRK
jgi:predicted RNase H-like nuclease (RuvC/YqgF family)